MIRRTIAGCIVAMVIGGFYSAADAANYLELITRRDDDQVFPGNPYSLEINMHLDAPGVTGVSVSNPGGGFLLNDGGSGDWSTPVVGLPNLATLIAASNGSWLFNVTHAGGIATLGFNLNSSGLTDAFFPLLPTNLNPAHGDTGVPLNTNFSWFNPNASPIDVLTTRVAGNSGNQEDNSKVGSLNVSDTIWNPPLDIEAGGNEFSVGFYLYGIPSLITGLQSGGDSPLIWGNSPFASNDWPAGLPMLVLGAETTIAFNNAIPEPSSLGLLALAGLTMLRRKA